jgi:hypothetical protein
MRRWLPFVLLLSFSATDALDPGTAKGIMQVGEETIALTHAYAQLHDNAEGLLDQPQEMRILIADREVEQEALNGLVFLPVRAMAREDKIRGLLLTFDPHDRDNVVVTFLYPPVSPTESLRTQSRMNSEGVMKTLKITDQRVVGEIEDKEQRESRLSDMPSITYATSFSAPLFHEPDVTEDLKGQAAKNSPQVKVLRAAAEALKKADFEALRKMSTARANRQTEAMLAQGGAQVANFARQAGKEMAQSINKVQRIVVRGNRAAVIFPDKAWRNLERVGGEWKIDE